MRTESLREVQYSRMLLVLGGFIAIGVAVAVGAVFGSLVRGVVLVLALSALSLAARRTRLVVTVDAEGVRVEPAHIVWPFVDSVEVLDAAAMRTAVSTGAHPNDYLRIRGTGGGMRLWLDDSMDPHRAWVVSIRDVASLRGVIEALEAKGIVRAA